MSFLMVATGGAVGALLRHSINLWLGLPLATLSVNILGAFVMGIASVYFADRFNHGALLLSTGILGGFTTFSAFSLDVIRLYEADRILQAGGYVVASVAGSLLAVFLGIYLARLVMA